MIEKQLPKQLWKRCGRIRFILAAILFALWGILASLLLTPRPAAAATGPTCYVKAGAAAPDGNSWATAYATVQDALADANCAEIWVAAGVYYPDEGAGQTNDDRASTFVLTNTVALYGGFVGTETLRTQRDVAANVTVLSGDIDQNDTTDANGVVTDTANIAGSNAYHVVTGSGTDNTAVLDGFTVTAGQSDIWPNYYGGGMYNDAGSPTLTRVAFSANSAYNGGGMYNISNSNPTLINVAFSANSASNYGGGMYNDSSDPALMDVTFSANLANSASGGGGGMYNKTSSPTLTNVTFSANLANSATNGGGGVYNENSSPTLTNVTFSANSAGWEGGGMTNNTSNPTLTNVTFSGNTASNYGGGMSNNNTSNPTLTNVTFSANSSTYGGGMSNWTGSPTLTNVTFSGNTASWGGGGMYNWQSNLTLTNVTFSANSANTSGGGMYNANSSPTLTNVIIANSASGGDCVNDTSASLNAASSNNLIEDAANACGLTDDANGSIIGQDPNLGALTDYGGPGKQVFPLLSGSPAVDAGDNANCPATDQRGAPRDDGACDIGAFEGTAAPPNDPPVAAAGAPQTVNPGDGVTLDGSGSSDPNNDPLTYGWTQIGGTAVTLSSASAVSPTFTAPAASGILTFSLTVTDTGSLTDTATTTVTVSSANQPPTADAGADQNVAVGATVTLDGSGSNDSDGNTPLTYQWTQTGGPAVTLSDATAVQPTFTAPNSETVLTFTLTVTDSLGLASTPDTVTVTVNKFTLYLPLILRN